MVTHTLTTRRLEALEAELLLKLSSMRSYWEQEMGRSDKSLEVRRAMVENLKRDLSETFQDCQIFSMTLSDRLAELAELDFATGLPLSLVNHIQGLGTFSKETSLE